MKILSLISIIILPFLLMAQTNEGTFTIRKKETTKVNNESTKVYNIVENMPSFPGGPQALITFLDTNLKYPVAAMEAGISGTVYVSFIILADGSINNVNVIRGVSKELDDEAIRVIKLMPNLNPGVQRGKPVQVMFNIPIEFILN